MKQVSTHKILMAKRVASRYLQEVSKVGRTLTVYFPSDSAKTSYLRAVKASGFGEKLSCTEGFDQVTLVSLDKEAVDAAEQLATDRDLDWSDF